MSRLLGLGEPVPTCAGGSILLQPDNTGELAVVLDKASEQLSTSFIKDIDKIIRTIYSKQK